MSDDQGEKTEEPSQHKLDEARNKGDVASSKELNSVLILTGVLCVLVMSSLYMFEVISDYMNWIYGLEIKKAYTEEIGTRILKETLWMAGKCVAPVFITSMGLGFLAQVVQVGILYAPDVLQMKPERISPIAGFKRIFSKKAIAEVVKGLLKFTIVLVVTYVIISESMNSFTGFLHTEAAQAFSYGKMYALKLSLSILAGLVVVAVADFIFEKWSYKQKHRMTKQQVKEENKEREGSPEVKQRIRTIQRDMATKRMMADIPGADVVITNPTHISIVIKYDSNTMIAPEIVGKGQDHLAMTIREIAKANNVPIVENVPLARALYKTVKVGEGVPRSLYKAVAEILAFVYKLRRKKKALA